MQHIPRFFTEEILKNGTDIIIADDNHHHIRNVLRMKEGSKAFIFNGKDGEFTAILDKCTRQQSHFILGEQSRVQNEERGHGEGLLIIGLLKSDIMGWLVEKSCELGVGGILPIVTEHGKHEAMPRLDKLRLRGIKAAQQCERLSVPNIHNAIPLSDLPSVIGSGRVYAGIERGEHVSLGDALSGGRGHLLIGPAGGFSDGEVEYLLGLENVVGVSLGRNLLRAETAALVGLSLIYMNSTN